MPSKQKVGKILVNNSICGNNVVDAQYVKVFLHSNDKHVFGLVDTGAETSVGNPQLLAKLPSDVMGVVNIVLFQVSKLPCQCRLLMIHCMNLF